VSPRQCDWLTPSILFAPQFAFRTSGVKAKQEGEAWLIERNSLHDFHECLWLVQHWND
jgi:hypothetical protein